MGLTGDDDPIKKIHGEEDVRSWYPPSQVADDIKEIEAMSRGVIGSTLICKLKVNGSSFSCGWLQKFLKS